MEEKFYTCRYDRPFKEIMLNENNKDILTWFLETTLKVKIKSIEVQTVERNTGNLNVKRKILDALLITNVGKIQIELNSNNADYVHARNMAYISDIYSHDTLIGETYSEQTKFIQINLTYNLKDNKSYRIYKMMDNEGKLFVENFAIYEFNMDFYKKMWDNKDEKLIEENKALIILDLDLENLKILSKEDRLVDKYMNNLENINKEPTFREYMSYEEDQRKIRNTLMQEGYKEGIEKGLKDGIKQGIEQGIEKGIEQGIKQGAKENSIIIAKKLLDLGINKEDIIKSTGLSMEELESIK